METRKYVRARERDEHASVLGRWTVEAEGSSAAFKDGLRTQRAMSRLREKMTEKPGRVANVG